MKSETANGIIFLQRGLQLVKVPQGLLVVVLFVLCNLVRAETAVDETKLATAKGRIEIGPGLVEGVEVEIGGSMDLRWLAASLVARDQDGDSFPQRGQDLDGLCTVLSGVGPTVPPLVDQELQSGADEHVRDGGQKFTHSWYFSVLLSILCGIFGAILGRVFSAICHTPRELTLLRRDLRGIDAIARRMEIDLHSIARPDNCSHLPKGMGR